MDIQQLKLLAGRVRGLLEQSQHSVGHNQSLDLIAALPGLRNWPEVQAFPDRVATCQLDATSCSRLAFRLKKKFALDLPPQSILAALSPPDHTKPLDAPQIWPTGPAPGVYITDSQEAINALLERYEDATDGALVYAERAGNQWAGSIDLGEAGLWSNGLQRVPSGTLIVVGPLELDQQSWKESSSHLEMACLIAQGAAHRVAVLVKTPSPEAMFEDVQLMVRSVQSEGDDCHAALVGWVDSDGGLQPRQPFATPRPSLRHVRSIATAKAFPNPVKAALQKAVKGQKAGLLLFGSSQIHANSAIELVEASLALTEHAGPAARIMARHRSTPAKDWQVPPSIQQLPFLPSIESAYEQGYRRVVFEPTYTPSELLLEYSKEVMLISGTYGSDVDDIFMTVFRSGRLRRESDLLPEVIAILGAKNVPTKLGTVMVSDLYVRPRSNFAVPEEIEAAFQFLRENRVFQWEEEMKQLIDSNSVDIDTVKQALSRNRAVVEYLATLSGATQANDRLARA
ncbi:hypothetical protein AVHY2522_13700 [Acidovorax sp. SUPP2522]|uniref:hypothetical protein n=1 Tax=unclassified Acidovorax TaxID=2684926 RepID=UPI002349D247|nr:MULTISPECIES: hypothetical protein [unclassified Acidovorax]WCN00150.1 hypothetical protein M5C96_12530 [Acidovorax sp. GBBC 1281]GKT17003.1 hypothetical protein AVHY2522_13700 [Acidovorax sp. SUPP2522]